MSTPSEPRNPFYLLLLAAGLAFVMTALACAFIPILEQKATDAGNPPPPSPLRDALRSDGWKLLLVEVAVVVVLAVASMVLDHLRTLKSQRGNATISGEKNETSSTQPPG
jgi:hypothetical protein